MKEATLIRIEHGEQETVGTLLLDGRILCFILEDSDRDNAPGISRIPEGSYLCKRVVSPKFGDTFEVTGVPGRDLIRFHWGNTHKNTRGCPLTGSEAGWFNNEQPPVRAILGSKKAFRRFMAKMEGVVEFRLTVMSVRV
jgi:hypothetical protein